MRFTLTFSMDNAAFDDPAEVGRVLADVAERVDSVALTTASAGKVRDVNGNTIGRWEITTA